MFPGPSLRQHWLLQLPLSCDHLLCAVRPVVRERIVLCISPPNRVPRPAAGKADPRSNGQCSVLL